MEDGAYTRKKLGGYPFLNSQTLSEILKAYFIDAIELQISVGPLLTRL